MSEPFKVPFDPSEILRGLERAQRALQDLARSADTAGTRMQRGAADIGAAAQRAAAAQRDMATWSERTTRVLEQSVRLYAEGARYAGTQVESRRVLAGLERQVSDALQRQNLVLGDRIRLESQLARIRQAQAGGTGTTGGGGSVFAFGRAGMTVAGAYLGVQGASGALEAADNQTLMAARLRLATQGQQEFTLVLEELRRKAIATGTELEGMVQLYTRMARTVPGAVASTRDLVTMTDLVSKSLLLSGATTAEATSVTIQLTQALGRGVLRGQEFNAIMSNGGRLAQALADGLGVSQSQLLRMAQNGELITSRVFPAFLSQAERVNAEFARMPKTFGQGLQAMKTAIGELIGELDKLAGAALAVTGDDRLTSILARGMSRTAGRLRGESIEEQDVRRAYGSANQLGVAQALSAEMSRLSAMQRGERMPATRSTWWTALTGENRPENLIASQQRRVDALRELLNERRTADGLPARPGGMPVLPDDDGKKYHARAYGEPTALVGEERTLSQWERLFAERRRRERQRFDLLSDDVLSRGVNGADDNLGRAIGAASTQATAAFSQSRTGRWLADEQARTQVWEQMWRRATTNVQDALAGIFSRPLSSFRDFARSLLQGVRDLTAQIMATGLSRALNLPGLLARGIGAFSGSSVGGAGSNSLPTSAATELHAGGVVGASGRTRSVTAWAFLDAPRMHRGGIAGLAPDEVPAILQEGETVLPRGTRPGGGATVVNVTFAPQLIDSRGIHDVLEQAAPVIVGLVSEGLRDNRAARRAAGLGR